MIRRDAEDKRIDVECAELADPPRSGYRGALRVVDGFGDMHKWPIAAPGTAMECGSVVTKEMFELRKGQVCN